MPLPANTHAAAAMLAQHSRMQYAVLQAVHTFSDTTAATAATLSAEDMLHGDMGLAHDPLLCSWHDMLDPERRKLRQARRQEALRLVQRCRQMLERSASRTPLQLQRRGGNGPLDFVSISTLRVCRCIFLFSRQHSGYHPV